MINPTYLKNNAHALDAEIDALPSDSNQIINAHTSCTALAFNSHGDTLATGGEDKCVKIWSTKDMKEVAVLKTKSHPVCAVAFSLDNEMLMSTTTDHKITFYSIKGKI